MKVNIIFVLLVTSLLISCNPEVDGPQYSIPSTYVFTDSEGNSTVNYSGQIARKAQLAELTTYMKSANTPGTALSEDQLLEMYSNNNGAGSSFFSSEAAAIDKQLRNKTARGDENYIAKFENLMTAMASASAGTEAGVFDGGSGNAGVIQSGTAQYLIDSKGAEFTQLIEKGLMGTVFYDQIQNVYLGVEKMDVDNSVAVDPAAGKYYTAMEHHWDEAFGYFTTEVDFPNSGSASFWAKYSNTVDPIIGSNNTIMNAFLKGRAAISNGDMQTRDEQITILRTTLEKVTAGTALHYLNGSIANFSDDAIRCHEMSEAVAFIEALYFSNSSTTVFTSSEISSYLETFRDLDGDYDFFDLTISDISSVRDDIATKIGYANEKASF